MKSFILVCLLAVACAYSQPGMADAYNDLQPENTPRHEPPEQ
ncbi:hypothetical protein [Caenimonas koreensis]|nr:hypothetical protein [Caenimonas koreensis]